MFHVPDTAAEGSSAASSTPEDSERALLLFPFPVASARYGNGYIFIGDAAHEKGVRMKKEETDRWYVLEEKIAGKFRIKKRIPYVMKPALADFFLPSLEEPSGFFADLEQFLREQGKKEKGPEADNGDFSLPLSHLGSRIDKECTYYPLQLLTLSGVFKHYNFKDFKGSTEHRSLVQKIQVGDPPPNFPPEKTEVEILERLGVPVLSRMKEALGRAFSLRPIWPVGGIEAFCRKALPGILEAQKWTTLKVALACVAYTYSNGPWSRLWVKLGYDPVKNPESFRYQVYILKNVTKTLVIADHPEILEVIEGTPGYTTRTFDKKKGYLTDKCLKYLKKKLSQIDVPRHREPPQDILGAQEFETLDE